LTLVARQTLRVVVIVRVENDLNIEAQILEESVIDKNRLPDFKTVANQVLSGTQFDGDETFTIPEITSQLVPGIENFQIKEADDDDDDDLLNNPDYQIGRWRHVVHPDMFFNSFYTSIEFPSLIFGEKEERRAIHLFNHSHKAKLFIEIGSIFAASIEVNKRSGNIYASFQLSDLAKEEDEKTR